MIFSESSSFGSLHSLLHNTIQQSAKFILKENRHFFIQVKAKQNKEQTKGKTVHNSVADGMGLRSKPPLKKFILVNNKFYTDSCIIKKEVQWQLYFKQQYY